MDGSAARYFSDAGGLLGEFSDERYSWGLWLSLCGADVFDGMVRSGGGL